MAAASSCERDLVRADVAMLPRHLGARVQGLLRLADCALELLCSHDFRRDYGAELPCDLSSRLPLCRLTFPCERCTER